MACILQQTQAEGETMRLTPVNLAGCVILSLAATACGGDEPQVPPATSQTQSSRQPNQPTSVTGCLRAGDAANTFVLTATATGDAAVPATYHLTSTGNANLQDHIGKRVEVSGVVEAQSQIATREAPKPADNATGTAGSPGTPTVQTGTRLDVQRIDVASIRPTGESCGDQ
jgi:hypothetical protein